MCLEWSISDVNGFMREGTAWHGLLAGRKRDHGSLINRTLALGAHVKAEKLSYRSLQRCYGRSIKVRAPGEFMSRLSRKAERAGGQLETLDTWALKLSQYDHIRQNFEKKPLSQRWHQLGDRTKCVQRDAYSAFLAKHATGKEHSPTQLKEAWAVAELLLRRAGLCVEQPASGPPKGDPTVFLLSKRVACRRGRKNLPRFIGQSRDGVAVRREPGTPDKLVSRTPGL